MVFASGSVIELRLEMRAFCASYISARRSSSASVRDNEPGRWPALSKTGMASMRVISALIDSPSRQK